jgi:hypothetical protein
MDLAGVGMLVLVVGVLVVGVLVAAKGLALFAEVIAGRRIAEAVRAGDGARVRRAAAGAEGLAGLERILRRLPTSDLIALGDEMAAATGEERGAEILGAIAAAVERREQVAARWRRLREEWEARRGAGASS